MLTGHHNPFTLWEYLSQTPLIKLTYQHTLQEYWYKLIAEALQYLADIPPLYTQATITLYSYVVTISQKLYPAVIPQLSAHDLDSEIKGVSFCSPLSPSSPTDMVF